RLAEGTCFNSATAPQPWKTARGGRQTPSRVEASIRPRHLSRGKRCKACHGQGSVTRFNSATAPQPWKSHRRCQGETSEGSFNAATAEPPWKTWLFHRKADRHYLASMRPRLSRRGKPRHPGHAEQPLVGASMRPRLSRRGKRPPDRRTTHR